MPLWGAVQWCLSILLHASGILGDVRDRFTDNDALPTGSTNGVLWSVAVNSSGNVIMGGSALNADGKWAPLAYEWMGSSDASVIETPPPQLNYRGGSLFSVAINTDGTAIMGGYSTYVAPPTGGAAAGGSFTSGSP